MPRTFPPGFRWGVATSGHQSEGGNTCSDTWFLENVRPTAFREPSGRACDSYERWREDVDLVAGLGLVAYRFCVEWARVAAAEGAGGPRYRGANLVLPEEMDAIADGMAAGQRAAREAIKARRPGLPVGLSLAIIDDQVVGDDASVRDGKRAEVYGMWLDLARDDDFVGVQNYERVRYDGRGPVPPPPGAELNQLGSSDIYPVSLAGAVRYGYQATGVP